MYQCQTQKYLNIIKLSFHLLYIWSPPPKLKLLHQEKMRSPHHHTTYLHPSDYHHHILTPIFLNVENYELWAKLARNNLRAKQLLGFIEGTILQPSSSSTDYNRWVIVNFMLIGWLYTNIEPKIHHAIFTYKH